jgi:myosin regulatory light chain 12
MIDQDNDGIISEGDLKGVLTSLGPSLPLPLLDSTKHGRNAGQTPTTAHITSLLASRPASKDSKSLSPGGINFALFLTMMSEHLSELDTEMDLLEAFACFDEGDKGWIDQKELREWLRDVGDRMSQDEVSGFVEILGLRDRLIV